jgi:hypothetical protein
MAPPSNVEAPTVSKAAPSDRRRIAVKKIHRHPKLKNKDSPIVFIDYEDLQKWG